jgi:arsenate reductase
MTSAPTQLYHNTRCSKSRSALELLNARGIEPEIVHYLEMPPSPAELRELLRMLGTNARGLLRTGEPEYDEMGLGDPLLGEDALRRAADHRAVVGRPPERVLEIL